MADNPAAAAAAVSLVSASDNASTGAYFLYSFDKGLLSLFFFMPANAAAARRPPHCFPASLLLRHDLGQLLSDIQKEVEDCINDEKAQAARARALTGPLLSPPFPPSHSLVFSPLRVLTV